MAEFYNLACLDLAEVWQEAAIYDYIGLRLKQGRVDGRGACPVSWRPVVGLFIQIISFALAKLEFNRQESCEENVAGWMA